MGKAAQSFRLVRYAWKCVGMGVRSIRSTICEASQGLLVNPLVAPNTLYPRIVKGGSWDDGAVSHRSAARMGSEEAWKQQDPQIPKSVCIIRMLYLLAFGLFGLEKFLRLMKWRNFGLQLKTFLLSLQGKDI